MKNKLLLAIVLGTLLSGSMTFAAELPAPTEPVAKTEVAAITESAKLVEVTLTQDAQEIQVEKGAQLKISVEANPTTGYNWEIEDFKPSLLEVVETGFISKTEESIAAGEPALVGAGGVKTFLLRAKKAGSSSITFWYKRPWEDGEPAKAYVLNVEVK